MSTQNTQPGPIAQQLVKMQVNGQQAPSGATNGQHPTQGKPQKRAAQWTGFAGKTLWDWLNLLGAAVLIPVVIAAASIWFSVQQNATSLQLAQKQHDSDQAIALDQQRQTVLQTYEDNIKDLLLTKGLHTSEPGDGVRSIARASTLTALHQLDGDRKGLLIQFLSEAGLITPKKPNNEIIISLAGADLSGANLHFVTLDDTSTVKLSGADLRDANLSNADLTFTSLSNADLSGADLTFTSLSNADLSGANLSGANLSEVSVEGAIFVKAYLVSANLHGADLRDADLHQANLTEANLTEANLYQTNLTRANLYMASVTQEQLRRTLSLSNATMTDGSTHP